MKLQDFYNNDQILDLLGYKHRMQITRWRKNYQVKYLFVCGKPYYWRVSVDEYLQRLVENGKLSLFEIEDRKRRQLKYNLSTKEYLPPCQALNFIEMGKTSLYDKAGWLGLIRTKKVYGFTWFNRLDLYDFLVARMSVDEVVAKRVTTESVVELPKLDGFKEWFTKNYKENK